MSVARQHGLSRALSCGEPRVQPAAETGGRNGGDRVFWVKSLNGGIGRASTLSEGTDHAAAGMAAATWAQPHALPQQFPLQP